MALEITERKKKIFFFLIFLFQNNFNQQRSQIDKIRKKKLISFFVVADPDFLRRELDSRFLQSTLGNPATASSSSVVANMLPPPPHNTASLNQFNNQQPTNNMFANLGHTGRPNDSQPDKHVSPSSSKANTDKLKSNMLSEQQQQQQHQQFMFMNQLIKNGVSS